MENLQQITLKNPKIISFFEKNKNYDPEIMFLYFLEFLENININLTEKVNTTINNQILSGVLELKNQNNIIYDNLNKINTEITNSILLKMHDVKNEYIHDMKLLLANDTNDKIVSILEKNNSNLIDKTTIVINDIIPKNNQTINSHINEQIYLFQKTITDDTNKIINSLNENNKGVDIKEYFNIFEQKFSNMIEKILIPINTITHSNEKFNDFINKYSNNANYKGLVGENQLYFVLNNMFPNGEIVTTTGQKESGDFLLKREHKPNIIFENKNYLNNVPIDEVLKFIRDIGIQKTHGIFLSQNSGICLRDNYKIEYHNGVILVFLHKVNYSPDKIQIAVDIIDQLSLKIGELCQNDENTNNISNDLLEEINKEYQKFAIYKEKQSSLLKDYYNKSVSMLNEHNFPSLEKYLSNKFASTSKVNNRHRCEYCEYVTTTLKKLSAHKRVHKTELKNEIKNEIAQKQRTMGEKIFNRLLQNQEPNQEKHTEPKEESEQEQEESDEEEKQEPEEPKPETHSKTDTKTELKREPQIQIKIKPQISSQNPLNTQPITIKPLKQNK